ncbi:DUF305 domain-containing protein [Psychrobacter urativorans]|uniref:CopM family metallochaperone n=1 Tax=Psychrobacter urativorans TaxID=45610 RepID=UPI001918C1AF|nr:DUF305 domain-containing protein [Psychrobacter urativorans]
MIVNHKSRFAFLTVSISAALALSACQPEPTDDTIPPPIEGPEPSAQVVEPHADHDMSADAMAADGAPTTDMLKEYTESMTTMHDEMMVGMNYNDPDTAFAQGMLGHHIGAVDMSEIELKYGTDAEMRKLAQEIIDAQQSEIATMKTWLANNPDVDTPTADTKAMQQAYADGMDAMHDDMMLGIADPIPDMAFARGMLPHHVGAVDMAEVQLKYGKDPEMRKLAQEIIDAQQPEIEQMQSWIAANKG